MRKLKRVNFYNVADLPNTENYLGFNDGEQTGSRIAGQLFRVTGQDEISSKQSQYDVENYIIDPISGNTPEFRYDFPANAVIGSNSFFGAQWLNLCLVFPQHVWAFDAGTNRTYKYADVFYNNYTDSDEYVIKHRLAAG